MNCISANCKKHAAEYHIYCAEHVKAQVLEIIHEEQEGSLLYFLIRKLSERQVEDAVDEWGGFETKDVAEILAE